MKWVTGSASTKLLKREINELSNEHVFSRQFLEISTERIDNRSRQELAKKWEINKSCKPGNKDHISQQRPPDQISFVQIEIILSDASCYRF